MKIFLKRSSEIEQKNKLNKKLQKEDRKIKYTLISQNHSKINHNVIAYLSRFKINSRS